MTFRMLKTCFLGLGVVGLCLFVVFPAAYLLLMSTMDAHTFLPGQKFTALDNYQKLLSNSEFMKVTTRTLAYAFATVTLQLLIGVAVAISLTQVDRMFASFVLCSILIPYVLPTVIVAFVWKWMLHDSIGIANNWLESVGIMSGRASWFDKDNAFMTVVLVSVWQYFPFVVLLVYARLNSIPTISYEQAAADGFGKIQRFCKVTWPSILPVIAAVGLLRLLWMFTKFDTIWLLTGKSSAGSYTTTLPVLAYRETFESLNAGSGAAVSMVLVLVLLAIVSLYLTTIGRQDLEPN